jgi:hypothetical protein
VGGFPSMKEEFSEKKNIAIKRKGENAKSMCGSPISENCLHTTFFSLNENTCK